ncbi:MAG: hypothetical protein IJ599_04125 [Alphaproteobacteria bacterium]|nr:hypothetical protein [Alphaproteobacteria bacterium]
MYRKQHLWARGYFVATSGQMRTKNVQKCVEGQEAHHKNDVCKASKL